MSSIAEIFKEFDCSILFLAPPAWGKTREVHSILNTHHGRVIYISPLRALAQEFWESVNARLGGVYLKSCGQKVPVYWNYMVGTPETLLSVVRKIEWRKSDLLILDEVHLFYLWGSEFRESLLTFREVVFPEVDKLLSLSATCNRDVLSSYEAEVNLNFDENFVLSLGNFEIKNRPCLFCESSLLKYCLPWLLLSCAGQRKRVLLFVQYRFEVDKWLNWARNRKLKALGCKGGESREFIEVLKQSREVDLIVATTVLSHGVNLPAINVVIINYSVEKLSFLIQMLARGGRRGESFEVYSARQKHKLPDVKQGEVSYIRLIKGFIKWNIRSLF